MNFVSLLNFVSILLMCVTVNISTAETPDTANKALRSAYLQNSWPQNVVSKPDADRQLKNHFDVVIEILNRQTAQSLEEAFHLLEASYVEPLTNDKRAAKIRELTAARATQIERLKHYRDRGRFPQNDSENLTPVFVDKVNTHCAVGYLMHCSGHDNEVQKIVDTNNFVCIKDVQDGVIIDWVKQSGLTKSEAMLIQPTYPPIENEVTIQQFRDDPNFVYESIGLRVTDLEATEYTFNHDGNDFQALTQLALDNLDQFGVPFDNESHDGMHIGNHLFQGNDCRSFFLAPDAWISIWRFYRPLTELQNTSIIKISYKLKADSSFIERMNFMRRPLCGYASAPNRLARFEVRDVDGNLIDEIDSHAGWQTTTLNVGKREALITYYILSSCLDDPFDQYAHWGSSGNIFHELHLSPDFPPTEFTQFRGKLIGGGLAETQVSDDEYLRYNPGFTLNSIESPVWLIFESEVPAGDYELKIEAQAGTPGLSRQIELFNFNSGQYELVATELESFNVDTVTGHVLDSQNFDGETVRARIGWYQSGFVVNFPWEIRLDQIAWKRQE